MIKLIQFCLWLLRKSIKRKTEKRVRISIKQETVWKQYERKRERIDKVVQKQTKLHEGLTKVMSECLAIDAPNPNDLSMEEVVDMVAPKPPKKESFIGEVIKLWVESNKN